MEMAKKLHMGKDKAMVWDKWVREALKPARIPKELEGLARSHANTVRPPKR
jgi:hypothetical protein